MPEDAWEADASREAVLDPVLAQCVLPIQSCVARAVNAQVELAHEVTIAILAVFGR